ncbi:MAG: hypothetical protein ACD_3C00167G0003 [uncultured bacterium (gcode 4)]|uniref:Uncharacterized protein n=1 Tax=uncultured bacterium (gcode 4) TaxID=1234023 RepID=K2GWK1_9BACT|nr:MAG: hypothetical protein ACD_3C00167G0003 [uncultured bacterium (gcode 4)]
MTTNSLRPSSGPMPILTVEEIRILDEKTTRKGHKPPADMVEELWVDINNEDVWAYVYLYERVEDLIRDKSSVMKATSKKVEEVVSWEKHEAVTDDFKRFIELFCDSSVHKQYEALELCIEKLALEITSENAKLNHLPFAEQEVSAYNIWNLKTSDWIRWRENAIKAFKNMKAKLKQHASIRLEETLKR